MGGFSRYDISVEIPSIYYYKGTEVLKNKLGIKDVEILKEAESEITFRRVYELTYQPVKGRFGKTHLLNIHRYIFEDLYYFAGRIRYEDISKGQTQFCRSQFINENLDKLFTELKSEELLDGLIKNIFFERLAYYMAELNIIHPFREGNGRTIREFIRQLALKNGYLINWDKVTKDELLYASIDSVYDIKRLKDCLNKCAEKLEE